MRTELNIGYKLKFPNRAYEYEITGLLGRGASCFVYLARYTENGLTHKVILKEYNPKSLNLDRDGRGALYVPANCYEKFNAGMKRFEQGYKKQADMRLNSDITNSTTNIQEIHFANNTRYIEMTLSAGVTYRIDEQATDSTLYDFLRRMRSLATVIGHYHEAGYLHLDIKPDNVFAPKSNDGKDVILFDFDSMIEQTAIMNISTPLSYTKEWAAMEQLNPAKRMSICKATDIFPVGEMIFYRIFGRHSNLSERRSYSTYVFDFNVPLFRNVNPKVFPLLNELLKKTLCNVVGSRYQTTDELVKTLDAIIKLADPKEPYLVSSSVTPEAFFIGRDNELVAIHENLQHSNILFLSGIGGIGKSELAKNYAKQYATDYDTVLFATYNGSWMMLINDDTSIHIANFDRFPEEKEQDFYRRKVRKLKELCDDRTLFIIDNLNEDEFDEEARTQWKDILNLGCKLLITTRLREWGYPILEVDVFSEQDSLVKLFENYCAIKNDADMTAVQEIIDNVSGHTLTVELIAKQTKAGFSTPANMLTKLKEHGIAQSGKEKVTSIKDGEQTKATSFAHISALFDIAELNEQEKYVLANMSLIPPSGIKAELFAEWCELEDFDAVNSLINGGWLDRIDDVIKMHPVVAEVVYTTLKTPKKTWKKFLKNAREFADDDFSKLSPLEKYNMVLLFRRMLSVVYEKNIASKKIAYFYRVVADIVSSYGNLNECEKYLKRSLEIRLDILGENDINTAVSYISLGDHYRSIGLYAQAEENYHAALRIKETLYGCDSFSYGKTLKDVGINYCFAHNYDKAEEYLLKAKRIYIAHKGSDSFAVSKVDLQLAELYGSMHRDNEAEGILLDILQKRESCGDDTRLIHHALGTFYRDVGNYEKAIYHAKKNISMELTSYIEQHSSVATSYSSLGLSYLLDGDVANAELMLKKALDIRLNLFGEEHRRTAMSYHRMGVLYERSGEYQQAKANYQKAYEIRRILFGYDNEETLEAKTKVSDMERQILRGEINATGRWPKKDN